MVKLPFLPKMLLEILGNIPTIAFTTVNFSELLSKSKFVLHHMKEGSTEPEWLYQLEQILPSNMNLVTKLEGTEGAVTGQDLLKLYFAQLKTPGPLFLDMRPHHFSHQNGITGWKPSPLVYRFEPDFKSALIRLYQGFYSEDKVLFEQSLGDLGLTQGLNGEAKQTLISLFKDNFGSDIKAQQFRLNHFQESFAKIFEFFMENKVKLKTDFLYLGLYLTTLFMHMDQFKEPIQVQKIFKEIFP